MIVNEKLINILLAKIDELEREMEHDKIYINALETENVRIKQVNDELEKKIKVYE